MSRFSKVSSIFGRDAFATMRYVTLLNVSEIRDIVTTSAKSSKMMNTFASGTFSVFRKHVQIIHQRIKFRNHCKTKCGKAVPYLMAEVILCGCKCYIVIDIIAICDSSNNFRYGKFGQAISEAKIQFQSLYNLACSYCSLPRGSLPVSR